MAKKAVKALKKSTRSRAEPVAPDSTDADRPVVRVRMYRQGLGDCFLITFDVGRAEKHMLIDCGTLGATTTGVKMQDVVQDIAATTDTAATTDIDAKKGKLAVLVATHAHKDHVSGFLSQDELIKAFTIGNVWMPWTENPTDPLATSLGNRVANLRAAIVNAHALARFSSGPTAGLKDKLEHLSEFEGVEIQDDGSLAMGDTIADALDVVRKFKGATLTYFTPGPPAVELDEIPGFRFYVLGPPHDAGKLANMGAYGSDELYGLQNAVQSHADETETFQDDASPFDARFCRKISEADTFFTDYASPNEHYRRVDEQWLRSAAELAAKLDDFRNNTSLALAIERIHDGRVLLFPADAQQGNWLSWHDEGMEWTVKDENGRTTKVRATDLLARTVFYKVGHHSSHNATASKKGLDIMRANKELTAFIPVDRQVALGRSPKGSWLMPARPLYRQLLEACDGRVVRADLGWAADAITATLPAIEKDFENLATTAEWTHWKSTQDATRHVTVNKLFVDYELK